MNHLNPKKTGMAFAGIAVFVHLVWVALIVLGWAQGLLNFSLWAHMVQLDYVVAPFDAAAAVTVLVMAGIVGYVVGNVFAWVFNRAHR